MFDGVILFEFLHCCMGRVTLSSIPLPRNNAPNLTRATGLGLSCRDSECQSSYIGSVCYRFDCFGLFGGLEQLESSLEHDGRGTYVVVAV